MFPNDHAVYLHDTPSKSLFDKDERAFSSGCIRVRDPLKLAEILLDGQKGWDRAGIDGAIASGKTTSVSLAKPIPVWLTYWTAWVDADGAVEFRRDLYGRDDKVLSSLAAPFKIRKRGV
jgi:murein L,D-transpeptidase YcbB/YkuD